MRQLNRIQVWNEEICQIKFIIGTFQYRHIPILECEMELTESKGCLTII